MGSMESQDWEDIEHLSAEMRRYIEATSAQSMAERQAQIRFAAILCRCRPWYSKDDRGPAQYGCAVHTTIVFEKNGEWL